MCGSDGALRLNCRKLPKPAQQRSKRVAPVAHLKFLFCRYLAERAIERGIEEQRIVAKAPIAAGRNQYVTLHNAAFDQKQFVLSCKRQNTDESSFAVG